jgi:hypothetical protein
MPAAKDIPPGDLARRLHQALPLVRDWVQATIAEHQGQAVAVSRMGYGRLAGLFPASLLTRARAVMVVGEVPFPPLSRMGLPELAAFEAMPITGVTYRDLFFVRGAQLTESLCCHELVHVVQWDHLGLDRFLLAYGIGLLRFGYRENPLEQIAYDIQDAFEGGMLSGDLMGPIQRETDAVWQEAAALMGASG